MGRLVNQMEDEGVAVPGVVRAWSEAGPDILAGEAAQGTEKLQGGGGWRMLSG